MYYRYLRVWLVLSLFVPFMGIDWQRAVKKIAFNSSHKSDLFFNNLQSNIHEIIRLDRTGRLGIRMSPTPISFLKMGYPGAYAPVISMAASGWVGDWTLADWWRTLDVRDPTNPADFYITDFSSRELSGQDLDVAAPGSLVVGQYQFNRGAYMLSFYYLDRTSMASPYMAGIVALIAQKDPSLTAEDAETILEAKAIYLPPGWRDVNAGDGNIVQSCWGADATRAGLITANAAVKATHSSPWIVYRTTVGKTGPTGYPMKHWAACIFYKNSLLHNPGSK